MESDSHHHMLVLVVGGRETRISTRVSHGGNEDIPANIVAQMAKQCHLTNEQFGMLVRCPLSASAYVELVRQKGAL